MFSEAGFIPCLFRHSPAGLAPAAGYALPAEDKKDGEEFKELDYDMAFGSFD
ncbi:hypothetical protein LTLLF_201150 [Microtus ochrogaster]|uniref:Uncharacterized protein n=1 Tax=Microtus ochrogaster TaxID=79684 RepID=A0A8J6KKG9_MICOH|nr:hypothetical protein LTLLF_201150 [Microtus ochrogaster]